LTHTTINCSMCNMSSNDRQRITLFINPSIVKHAKAQAIVEETTLTDLVEKALIKYLPEKTVIKKSNIIGRT